MFLLFYLVYKCLAWCDVSYLGGWVRKRNVETTFLMATLVWMPPLKDAFINQCKLVFNNIVKVIIKYYYKLCHVQLD